MLRTPGTYPVSITLWFLKRDHRKTRCSMSSSFTLHFHVEQGGECPSNDKKYHGRNPVLFKLSPYFKLDDICQSLSLFTYLVSMARRTKTEFRLGNTIT